MSGLGLSLGLGLGQRYGGGGAPTPAPTPSASAITGNSWEGETLTVSPAGTSRQWTRSGSPISGATAATYVVDRADIAETIGCIVDGVAATGSKTGLIARHSRVVVIGDGVRDPGTGSVNEGVPDFLALRQMNNSLRVAVGGCITGSAGNFAAMQTLANYAAPLKPDVIMFHGVVNETTTPATFMAGYEALLDSLEASHPDAIIFAMERMMRPGNTLSEFQSIWASQAALASGPGGGNRGSGGKGRTIVVDQHTGMDYTVGVDFINTGHQNANGGRKLADLIVAAMSPLIQPTTAEDMMAETAAIPAKGLGAMLNTTGEYQLTGTAGAESGGSTGDTATGFTTRATTMTPATVVASKVPATGYDKQRITVSGTPSAAGLVDFFLTGSNFGSLTFANDHGDFFELLIHARMVNSGGGAPGGVRARQWGGGIGNISDSASGYNPLTQDTTGSTIYYDEVFDYVERSNPAGIGGATPYATTGTSLTGSTTNRPAYAVRFGPTACDAIIDLDRPIVRQVDTLAYAAPSLITFETASPGSAGINGTPGGTNPLVRRPGPWSGGGITLTYQWDLNGVDIPGATTAAYTQASPASGTVVGCTVTATNSISSATDRRTVTVP